MIVKTKFNLGDKVWFKKDDYTEDELDEWSVKNPTDSINIHEFKIADD